MSAFLLAPIASAQAVTSHPDDKDYVHYVGRYGQILKLRSGTQILPSMAGEVEVVNIVPFFRFDSEKPIRFRPVPEDFKPENFSKLGLIQMIVMPRRIVASKTFKELKESKIKDLEASGVEFRIVDSPELRRMYGSWPDNTAFEVYVGAPYKLVQLYIFTDSYLCILTAGVDEPPYTPIDNIYRPLRSSVIDWLVPVSVSDSFQKVTSRDILDQGLRVPSKAGSIVLAGLGIVGFSFLLAGFGRRFGWDWMYRTGISIAVFALVGCAMGGLIGLICWPFPWSYRYAGATGIIALLFMPILVGIIRSRRRRGIPLRAILPLSVWWVAAACFSIILSVPANDRLENAALIPFSSAMMSFIYWAVAGFLFGIMDSASPQRQGERL